MKCSTACILLSALGYLHSAEIAQWPQYRGPQGAGITTTAGPLQFGPKQNLQWSAEVPHGHSSPSIWGDTIFLTSFDKNTNKLEVLAFDRKTGKARWRQPVPAAEIEKVHKLAAPLQRLQSRMASESTRTLDRLDFTVTTSAAASWYGAVPWRW
jgi:outer membrane protein assembly factor BamB